MAEPRVAEPDVPNVCDQEIPVRWEAAFALSRDVVDEAPEVVPDDDDTFIKPSVVDYVKPPIDEWTHWEPEPILKENSDAGN